MKAWAESLGGINYPLLSDFWPHGAVAEAYGVMRQKDGFTERAIFVIDRDGIIRYIDIHDIDDRPDNEEVRKVLREIESRSVVEDAAASAVVSLAGEEKSPPSSDEITVYCAQWCRDCVKVKKWLEGHGLPFVELDIDYEPDARSRVRQWCGGKLITPVVDFYGTIIIDYSELKLEDALRKHAGR